MSPIRSGPLFDTLGIAGVGLIGGSAGLAAKARGIARRVIGIGRSSGRLAAAVQRGSVDEFTTDMEAAARECDFLYLATPVDVIRQQILTLSSLKGLHLIVSDAGSAKREIVQAAAALPDGIRFVGGHPMTGSEQAGVEAAREDLFEGATYALTPVQGTDPRALDTLRAFAEALGSRVYVTSPEAHDHAVAATSHLPHLIAGAFLRAADGSGDAAHMLAGGSFRDLTRITDSSAVLWRDICHHNRDAILQAMEQFLAQMSAVKDMLSSDDQNRLEEWFRDGKSIHAQFGTRKESER